MKILVLNCGSSSLKYQLINMETEELLASGKYERIGEKEAFITHKACGKKVTIENPAYNHKEAIEFTLKQFTNPEYKVIESLDEINAIGHRLVHGGEKISESVVIDEKVEEVLKEYYSPDYEELWDNCTFIFDTSVLLNLYRFNDETKEIFLDVIEKIGERKWIPYK